MLINKADKLVKKLDFRGTKIEYLDKVSSKDLLLIVTAMEQQVNVLEKFKATDLTPKEGCWSQTVYNPIMEACKQCVKEPDKAKSNANRLLGVIIKSALIMSPLLFRQTSEKEFEGATYAREALDI